MRLHNKAQFGVRIHTITTAGTPEHLGGYMVAATISFNATTLAIADSGSEFLTKGFRAGDTITVSGSTSNDDDYVISTIAAGSLTVVPQTIVMTTEAAGATVTITANKRAQQQEIDDGVSVVLRAHPDNTGALYVAGSSTDIADSTKRITLYASQSVSLQVQNYRAIWCDVATSGEKVEITNEK